MNRPAATLSLDLDNEWAYLRARHAPQWDCYPSYLPRLVPRVLEFLASRGLTITFFVVGQDAELDGHAPVLAAIAAAGHEIGNHSFGHETGFHNDTVTAIGDELARTEAAIEAATGYRPVGFRGPSYGLSGAVLHALAARGYLYDATTFPTLIGPAARLYFRLRTAGGSAAGDTAAPVLGESALAALRSLAPYRWQLPGGGGLIELPITTMPLLRLPIHATYLQWLGSYSTRLALTWLRAALALCRLRGVAPSLVLHPTDFLGGDEVHSLGHLPAMNVAGEPKRRLMTEVIALLQADFEILALRSYAETLGGATDLPIRQPDF